MLKAPKLIICSLKRTYLRLLLLYPFTNESQETETHLWITTSHAFISVYKQRLTELDRIQGTPSHAPGNERGQNAHGPVEYRKVLTRFRQFLSEEEVFWKLFVIRLRSISPEDNLNKALLSLDLTPGALEGNGILETVKYMFPPEQEPPHRPTLTAEEQTVRMNLVGKALVCLGDLARYREQYNEGNNRPRAGREDGPPAQRGGHRGRGRGRGQGRGGTIVERTARERDYTLAQRYYETAQRLIPSDGNASHQLAILASYKRDSFASLVHYIRSLCVTHPYVPGADNMASMLKKALDAWKVKQKDGRGKVADDPDMLPKDRAARLKDNIVVLHGFWKFGGDK
jgi:protein SMG7